MFYGSRKENVARFVLLKVIGTFCPNFITALCLIHLRAKYVRGETESHSLFGKFQKLQSSFFIIDVNTLLLFFLKFEVSRAGIYMCVLYCVWLAKMSRVEMPHPSTQSNKPIAAGVRFEVCGKVRL